MSTVAPRDAGTVPVRVQVIDVEPRVVDLVVPTYLKADDLTQRIARDAGLGAWWEDGTRRRFWLRARGRVMLGEERLADLGVVPYELLHLLPEPPPGAPVVERPIGLDVPEASRSASSWVARVAVVLGFAALWTVGASASPTTAVAFWPAAALAWWAGRTLPDRYDESLPGFAWRAVLAVTVVSAPAMVVGGMASRSTASAGTFVALAAFGGALGALLAFLTRMGPVEPLTAVETTSAPSAAGASVAMGTCGICTGAVTADHAAPCPYGCGRPFHAGCLRARQASASPGEACEMCGALVGRRA